MEGQKIWKFIGRLLPNLAFISNKANRQVKNYISWRFIYMWIFTINRDKSIENVEIKYFNSDIDIMLNVFLSFYSFAM